jgi:hypothetical protein
MRRTLIATALAALALAVAAAAPGGEGASASFGGSSGCVTLPATPRLKSALLRAHRATQDDETRTTGPFGRVYYGRCPRAFYALATFHHRTPKVDFGAQDQPERLQRRIGGGWSDRGDTGGFVCEAAPRALLKLWRLLENCD